VPEKRQIDISCHRYDVEDTGEERKLGPLKSKNQITANEAPNCAVPMQAPQTSSLWQGAGAVRRACGVVCLMRLQPKPL